MHGNQGKGEGRVEWRQGRGRGKWSRGREGEGERGVEAGEGGEVQMHYN